MITQLGIPVLYDWTKYKLDDISDVQLWRDFNESKKDYATLLSYDFDSQSPANQLNTKILLAYMKSGIDGEAFFYHGYPVNQFAGIQSSLPTLLTNKHKLRNKSDIKAYIARLEGFETNSNRCWKVLKSVNIKALYRQNLLSERCLIK